MSLRTTRSSALLKAAAAVLVTVSSPLSVTSADAHSRKYRHHHDRVVDAPFTHVETGPRHRTSVWAPFTRVHVSRRGTYVRAPFVDLFVPR